MLLNVRERFNHLVGQVSLIRRYILTMDTPTNLDELLCIARSDFIFLLDNVSEFELASMWLMRTHDFANVLTTLLTADEIVIYRHRVCDAINNVSEQSTRKCTD